MKKRFLPLLTLLLITGMSYAQTHTIKVTVADSIEVCYIAGTFNGWSGEPGELMTRISDTEFTFDFEAADTSGVEYKILTGPAWKYEQVQAANFRFSRDSIVQVDEFKAYYHTAWAKDVTIDVLVPAEVYELYLTGSFNGWDPTADKMEFVASNENGKEFTLTIFTLDTTTLEFKFIAGPGWPYEQSDQDNYVYSTDGGVVVCMDFKAIFDPNDVGDITLNITVPEGTAEVWIIGSFNNWSTETAIQATKNEDNTFTAVIPGVAIIDYKCYSFPDWPYEEAIDAEGNNVPDRQASFATGPAFDITVAFWKQLYVPEEPTAINDYEKPAKSSIYTTRYQTIVANEVTEKVTIFDIQGRIVQDVRTKGTFESKALRTGIYIIRVDGHLQKVAIQ